MVGQNIRLAKYDDTEMAKLTEEQRKTYEKDLNNYSDIMMTVLQDPSYSWAVPYVTGHKYRIFFDKGQLDITKIKMEISTIW